MTTTADGSAARRTITDTERYLFDLNGYLVIPDVLDKAALAGLNAGVDAASAAAAESRADPFIDHLPKLMDQGPVFRALLDHPPVAPYLEEWLGADYRFDHAYGMVIRRGSPRIPGASHLHGGGMPWHHSRGYTCQNGRIFSTETAVSFALTDVLPGDGGLGAIPGSHKASFQLPWHADPGPYPEEVVRPVPMRAGSAVIFTESLSHCTLPWRGAHERRALFVKYTPRNIQVAQSHHDPGKYPELTERQRALLEPAHTRPRR